MYAEEKEYAAKIKRKEKKVAAKAEGTDVPKDKKKVKNKKKEPSGTKKPHEEEETPPRVINIRNKECREGASIHVDGWPQMHEWKRWCINLYNAIQSTSAKPKEAWKIIRPVAKALTWEELSEEHGFETLWVKLRTALMRIIKGQLTSM